MYYEKVLVITGSYPPDVCGVGDYVACLKNTVQANNWEVFVKKDWKITNFKKYIKEIGRIAPDKIIIQYPTQGYGWSLLPFLLMVYFSIKMGKKCIVTYHEFSNQSLKAKLCQNFFLFGIKKLIVTNEYEKKAIRKWHKRLDISVIKIYSNIPRALEIKTFNIRKYNYCYFGQIRPNKGIEQFIELAKELDGDKLLLGTIPKEFEEYGQKIIKHAQQNNIFVVNNATLLEVSDLLNDCKVAILPFLDGVSERRGSFLAAIVNGCLICTTIGRYTTDSLKEIIYIQLPMSPRKIDLKLTGTQNLDWEIYNKKMNSYLLKNIPDSWESVAEQYNNL